MSFRTWGAFGLMVLVGGDGLVGCEDKNVANTFIQQALFPTRADAIATPVSDSWHDPTGSSINPARHENLNSSHFRVFRGRDGAGLVAFLERSSDLYLAYYGPSGAVSQPVRIRGDFMSVVGGAFSAAVCVWTPQGDAVIAFVANQADYPLTAGDVTSQRVYYTTFRRSLAAVSNAASGEEYGFETRAVPVDTNVVGSDDNAISTLFVATDLVDGSVRFSGLNNSEPDRASGDPGDAAGDHGGHFIFLGWVHENGVGRNRAEGAFVGLDSAQTSYLELGALQTVTTTPALSATEDLSTTVLTSGRDILFRWKQTNGAGTQERLSLVRVNAARTGIDPGIDVGRGTATASTTNFISGLDHTTFVGDGHRALNGQKATWLFFTQSGFVNGSSVTNADKDLVIARVDDAGQVSVSEFDHEGATSTSTNDTMLAACLVSRGASRALLLYRQTQDASVGALANNTSLFARAVYLDESAVGSTWPNVVSDEVRVNSTADATTTAPNADVETVWTATVEPFCGPQYNNDAFYVAFKQQIEADTDGKALRYARLEMSVPADVSASSTGRVTLSAAETTIEPLLDKDWTGISWQVALAEAGTADGAVVFYEANGNNRSDKPTLSPLDEARVYAWASQLPGATSGPPALAATEVSSIAAGLPSHWAQVLDWELHVTPLQAASRDYALDTDTAPAEFAHLLLRERDSTTNSPMILRGRAMDLRSGVATVGSARFFPAPGEEPGMVSSGRHGRTDSDMWSTHAVAFHGNALVTTFAENAAGSDGPDETFGQVFVNTFGPETRSWSDAAILSNESWEDVYTESNGQWVALSSGMQNGCPDALGAWIFWIKAPAGDTDDEEALAPYVQGRRFTGVALPSR